MCSHSSVVLGVYVGSGQGSSFWWWARLQNNSIFISEKQTYIAHLLTSFKTLTWPGRKRKWVAFLIFQFHGNIKSQLTPWLTHCRDYMMWQQGGFSKNEMLHISLFLISPVFPGLAIKNVLSPLTGRSGFFQESLSEMEAQSLPVAHSDYWHRWEQQQPTCLLRDQLSWLLCRCCVNSQKQEQPCSQGSDQ